MHITTVVHRCLIPITATVYVSSSEHEIHEMWNYYRSIIWSREVSWSQASSIWRIVLPFSTVCIIHDFREIYPVWGDRFLLESLTGREWHIASCDCMSNQDITGWPVFSNLFYALELWCPYPNQRTLHDAGCHSLPVRFSNFHFLLCAFLEYKWRRLYRFYCDGFLFE